MESAGTPNLRIAAKPFSPCARSLGGRFPGTGIGGVDRPEPLDLLTGVYGVCPIAAIYGLPLVFARTPGRTPSAATSTTRRSIAWSRPSSRRMLFFRQLEAQVEWIAESEGRVEGYLNWQGVLNNAHRLRGETLFLDLVNAPERARRLFECVATTMVDAARRLYTLQEQSGVRVRHFTFSNCLVNLVSPESYRDQLLEWDRLLARAFRLVGVHNCAWTIDGYVPQYATIRTSDTSTWGSRVTWLRPGPRFPWLGAR